MVGIRLYLVNMITVETLPANDKRIITALARSAETRGVHLTIQGCKVVESLIAAGQILAWRFFDNGDPFGVILVTFRDDPVCERKEMLIYAIMAERYIALSTWMRAWTKLKKMACDYGCTDVGGYTNVQRVINIVEKIGGDTKTRFVSMPI